MNQMINLVKETFIKSDHDLEPNILTIILCSVLTQSRKTVENFNLKS
jgi:hypothetical protein